MPSPQSPIGAWFYTFIIIAFLVCLFTFLFRRDHLKSENKLESLVSRESSFLFNNMILLAACFTVLWGTLFPLLSEAVTGSKVTMGAPFYNRVNIPIGLFLLFLTGIGPLLAWRSTSLRSIRRNFVLPSIAMAATAVVLMIARAASLERWRRHAVHLLLADRVHAGGGRDYRHRRGVHCAGPEWCARRRARTCWRPPCCSPRRNTRRYGGYIIHFGIVVLFIGIAGGAFNQAREMEMSYGDTALDIGPYRLVSAGMTQDSKPEYDTDYAVLECLPERQVRHAACAGEADLLRRHGPRAGIDHCRAALDREADLYTVFEGTNPDSGLPIIKVFLNPLIAWIWIGVVIVVAGTFIALVPNLVRSPVRQRQEDSVPVGACRAGRSKCGCQGAPCVGALKFEARGAARSSGRGRCRLALLCVVTVVMLGAGQSRFDRLGHELMCSCGCGQILLECNHVSCPDSARHDRRAARAARHRQERHRGAQLVCGQVRRDDPCRAHPRRLR